MKKITKTVIALSVLAGLASCTKELAPVTPETENNAVITLTLTAGQGNPETRAAIDAADSKVINWSADDKISIFDGDRNNREFTLKDGAGNPTGTFTGTVTKTSESGYTALYPYQDGASYDGSKIRGVTLSAAQTATEGSFDPKAALMCARSTTEDGNLTFKNIVGYVKFTTTFECSKITLVSKTSTDVLAGTAEITPGAAQLVSSASESSSQVTLSAASGNIAAGTYYIALLPGTLDSGFNLVFTMTDGGIKYKGTTNPLEIKSNGVRKLGTINEAGLNDVDYKDLSASESANSYLVQAAGDYKFKAVQGNTFKKDDTSRTGRSVGTVETVQVLWESFGTDQKPTAGALIASAKYSDGYIQFSTPATFAQGNAVIAAKDASGAILWSWHIWCASECWKEQVYYNNAGTMMDRNLGATTATAGEVGSLGVLYQWGRKDPFLGSSSVTSSDIDTECPQAASTATWSVSDETISATQATQNPMTFYLGETNCLPDGSWASAKTIYDPCPAGWRVPDGGEEGIWSKARGNSENFSSKTFGSFGVDGNAIWYPAAGDLLNIKGSLQDVGRYGHYWSVTPVPSYGPAAYTFGVKAMDDDPWIYPSSSAQRSYGLAVRCQKE